MSISVPAPSTRHALQQQLCAFSWLGQDPGLDQGQGPGQGQAPAQGLGGWSADLLPWHCQREIDSALPFIFAPPGAFPYLVDHTANTERPEVRYCPQALAPHAVPNGTLGTGELTWEGR